VSRSRTQTPIARGLGRRAGIALLGDLVLVALFPFLGASSHESAVTIESFFRTFTPFAVVWPAVGVLAKAYAIRTLRSTGRTLRVVPVAWLIAGVLAIAVRVFVFDRPFVLAFALVAIGVTGAMVIAWRLALAVVLGRR
jgi:hypothetical protein